LVAVRAGASGTFSLDDERTDTGPIAWSLDRGGPSMASPMLYGGNLYIAEQRGGTLACYDAKTGDEHYRERVDGARGFTSSLWAHDDKVFCLDEAGTTFVIKAGPEFEVLAGNKLDEMCWATPALAGDSLLLRTAGHLYCIRP
jgi:outer membrane protein assembly factor BamB